MEKIGKILKTKKEKNGSSRNKNEKKNLPWPILSSYLLSQLSLSFFTKKFRMFTYNKKLNF